MALRRGGRVVLLLASLLLARGAWAQFSPGPLSSAHRSLNGPTHCTACHSFGGERRFKCLQCHTEIRSRLAANRGYHPRLVHKDPTQVQCIKCHSEHNGADFVPIHWDTDLHDFDHSKTGYPLEGAHRKLDCRQCHTAKFVGPAERAFLKVKDLKRSYLGLSPQCKTCHEDAHHGQFTNCLQCHGQTKWKPASGFNHAQAKFQLNGGHATVACAKCHKTVQAEPKPFVQFVGVRFQTCDACHSDPHHGSFHGACESCHSVATWKTVRLASSGFDHSKTKFPLLGKHGGVSCDKCHKTSDFSKPIAHTLCIDCHSPAKAHQGQFLARADKGECASCHGVEGWKPAHFAVAQHRATHYPLEGMHAKVACAKCHKPAGEATLYSTVRFDRCDACHRDEHQGQFAAAPLSNRCEECHTVQGYRPSTFTLARHARSRFKLEGAHLATDCAACHAVRNSKSGRFRFKDRTCQGCHADPHRGQFSVRMASAGAGCETCHSLRSWQDMAKFDHSTTKFILAGVHRAVRCEECHKGEVKQIAYTGVSTRCGDCHKDVHGGQFAVLNARLEQASCGRCHGVAGWKSLDRFNHDRDSDFVLTGAHRAVGCAACHTQTRPVEGKPVVMYRLAPRDCTGCHGPHTQMAARE